MPPFETPRSRARAAVRTIAVLAALAPLPALLACGGSSPATGAAARERSAERSDELKAARFARCLREHGLNASASASGGGVQLRISPGAGTGRQSMEAAQNACAKYRPQPKKVNLSPQEKVKREEEVLKFAKCMREHGVEVHTEVGSGAVSIGIHGSSSGNGPNPASPAFQSAQKACSGYLQLKPKGGLGHPPAKPEGSERAGSKGSGSEAALAIGG